MDATDAAPGLEELLAPISEEEPAGPDLSHDDRYSRIELTYRDADLPPTLSPAGVPEEPDADFSEVVELATEFLGEASKDLKIAALLTAALIREEGFRGLASGLELLGGLMERYWDTLHPGPSGRAAVLSWLGSDDVSYALYFVPLTEVGHTYYHYKEWADREESGEDEEQASEPSTRGVSAANFGAGFAQTPRAWYVELCGALERGAAALERLETIGEELFDGAGERPPRYRDLSGALERVTTAARDLLGRKPAPPPETRVESIQEGESAGEGGNSASGAAEGGGGVTVVEPRDAREATTAVSVAARVLRRQDPCNPAPYLLVRGLRWGELRAAGEQPDPRVLAAPTTEQRTRLKTLFLDQEWERLREEAEEIAATPAGRGWLDVHRYAVLAAERLGPEYDPVAAAIRGALRGLLADVPELLEATLMDDSAAASRDTIEWLRGQGLIEGADGEGEAEEDASRDTDAERAIRRASFRRASKLARAGDPHGAIELLMERAEHEGSERARFITRAEAAGIMVDHGLKPLARPILDDLQKKIEEHKLEEWEPGEIVAKPLGLLMRCLEENEGALRQQLYGRLARLDPLLAMRVSADGREEAAEAAAARPDVSEEAEVGDG